MHSSTNAAWVGLVVVIALVLVGGVMVLLRGSGILLGGNYIVYAAFDDVSGIAQGTAVTANGVEVGHVEKIVTPDSFGGPVDAKLRIRKQVHLKSDATATVLQPDFLGEKTIALDGLATPDYAGSLVAKGDRIRGVNAGGVTAMVTKQVTQATEMLDSKLNTVLGGVQVTLGNANKLLEGMTGIMLGSEGYLTGTMKNFQGSSANMLALSKNLEQASVAVRDLSADPRNRDAIATLAGNMVAASENLRTMSSSMNTLIADPKMNEDTRATLAATRASMEALQKTMEGFQGTLGKVDTLVETTTDTMSEVGGAVSEVRGLVGGASGAVGQFTGGMGSGKGGKHKGGLEARFDLDNRVVDADASHSYTGKDLSVRDMNATLGYNNLYAQFGVDNIGAGNDFNFMLGKGNPNKGLSLKTGAYHGEVGTGLSWREQKNAGVDIYAYDSEDWKFNAYGKAPVNESVDVIVGMEDIGGSDTVTVGAGLSY